LIVFRILPNHIVGAVSVGCDINENFTKRVGLHIAVIDEALSGARIIYDCGQRLVQRVRYGCGHLTEQSDTVKGADLLTVTPRLL
jgi:hypothetical protein